MWTDNGDDFNNEGEAVRLYRPIIYGKRPSTDDLTCSFIGGETTVDEPPTCSSCEESLPLMLQLFVPKFPAANQEPTDRTLQIFACNRAACVNALTNDSKFSYGGAGVVVCRRLTMAPTVPKDDAIMPKPSPAEAQDSWVDGQGAGDDNDWAKDGAADSDMQDLESKLAIMETMKVQPKKAKASAPLKTSSKRKDGSFPCYELSALQEPRSVRKEGLDEDDVGFSGSDAKIKAMLARYMAEEDDEFILSALNGSASGGEGGGDGRGERDERLSPADRALLTYSDRLKRSPRQVARYALGGIPMWSIPTPTIPEQKKKQSTSNPNLIPPCACGAERVFETQLLSSLLHVLEVDKHAPANVGTSTASGLGAAYEQGGMNWGNIAIYSCPNVCAAEQEFVVVQDSDERPSQPRGAYEDDAALIPDDATFGGNDDDDDDWGTDDDEQDYDEPDANEDVNSS